MHGEVKERTVALGGCRLAHGGFEYLTLVGYGIVAECVRRLVGTEKVWRNEAPQNDTLCIQCTHLHDDSANC